MGVQMKHPYRPLAVWPTLCWALFLGTKGQLGHLQVTLIKQKRKKQTNKQKQLLSSSPATHVTSESYPKAR